MRLPAGDCLRRSRLPRQRPRPHGCFSPGCPSGASVLFSRAGPGSQGSGRERRKGTVPQRTCKGWRENSISEKQRKTYRHAPKTERVQALEGLAREPRTLLVGVIHLLDGHALKPKGRVSRTISVNAFLCVSGAPSGKQGTYSQAHSHGQMAPGRKCRFRGCGDAKLGGTRGTSAVSTVKSARSPVGSRADSEVPGSPRLSVTREVGSAG